MSIAEIVFWSAAIVLVYVYVGYPILARLLAAVAPRPVQARPITPTVTVIITAYNEEKGIRRKLENVMSLDYPRELLDIIVASDASDDGTDDIVRSFSDQGVKLVRVEGRKGKTACQNAAAEVASGEILMFTDATTEVDRGALRAMVANFADPSVGCVAGSLVYLAKGSNATALGGTAYWGFELGLRRAETLFGSLIGVSGCLYCVRKSSYRPIPPGLISDFVIALRIRERGQRTVLESRALCYEDTLERPRHELAMRIRVSVRSITALVEERRLMNPFRYGLFAVQLLSHKALRYLSPFFWITALVANAFLLAQPFYLGCFLLQLLVLTAGAVGFLRHGGDSWMKVFGKPYYFLLTNVSSLLAVFRYLRGERMVTWKPMR